MFLIAAEVYAFGAIIFMILGKGERQWWAGGPQDNVSAATDHEADNDNSNKTDSNMESAAVATSKGKNDSRFELKRTNRNNTVE